MRRLLMRVGKLLRRRPGQDAPIPSAAIEANQRGIAARDAGDLEGAIAAHLEATRVAPGWEAPWFNLGILYKHTGRWSECVEACRRALDITPSDGAIWNLGIAATALADWSTARAAWRRLGLSVVEGRGPVEMDLGPVPIRVDPSCHGEVVWCARIDPARAVIKSIPLPESGRRHGDLVLHDGAANGWRMIEGKEVPVFDELALLTPSTFSTFAVETEQPTPEDSLALEAALGARGLAAEDWTLQVRALCRACSEGRPHEAGEEHPREEVWQTSHRVGVAAEREEDVRSALAGWAAGASGRTYGEIALVLAAIG